MDEFNDNERFDYNFEPRRRPQLPLLFLLLVLLLSLWAGMFWWLTYVSPQELYHRVWQQTADEIYDQGKLTNWAQWEHKYDNQIQTREDAIHYANIMLRTGLKDTYSVLTELSSDSPLLPGYYVSTGIELDFSLGKDLRPQVDGDGRFLARSDGDGHPLIARINAGSPAEQAGLKVGDAVLSIDGKPTEGADIRDLDYWLESPRGRPAILKVRTAAGEVTVNLDRQRLYRETVKSEVMPGNVGYIRWDNFYERGLEQKVQTELSKLKGCDGLIIDLRNNPGGAVDKAVSLVSLFLEQGTITTLRERVAGGGYRAMLFRLEPNQFLITNKLDSGRTYSGPAKRMPYLRAGRPVIILVNGLTASASEMFTGALRDNNAAVVVGTNTLGKGVGFYGKLMPRSTVLTVVSLMYVTPSGKCPGDGNPAHSPGLAVDLLVPPDGDFQRGSADDNQLAKAHELMLEALSKKNP